MSLKMPWGIYKGQTLDSLPDWYCGSLADGFQEQKFGKLPDNQKFTVTEDIRLAAREEMKRRGFTKKGSRWV